jgi:hypothetical protein
LWHGFPTVPPASTHSHRRNCLERIGQQVRVFRTDFNSARIGLTVGQVNYRLAKAAVDRRDYRDGSSPLAVRVCGSLSREAEHSIRKRMEPQPVAPFKRKNMLKLKAG